VERGDAGGLAVLRRAKTLVLRRRPRHVRPAPTGNADLQLLYKPSVALHTPTSDRPQPVTPTSCFDDDPVTSDLQGFELPVWGLGFGVWRLGLRVEGLGFRV